MANKMLGSCPVCGKKMLVTRLRCDYCDTTIEGRFDNCKFCQLSVEQREFVEVFIKCRGNIKEVERELGISYPTVRNRLDAVIAALGYRVETTQEKVSADRRKEILDMLARGEMSSEEAIKALKGQDPGGHRGDA